MSLVKRNSEKNFPAFSNLLENFFGRDLTDFMGRDFGFNGSVPAVNIVENGDHFRLDVAAPGLKKENFRINIHDNQLTISSEMEHDKEEKTERYTRKEFNYSVFQRSFTLPNTVDSEKVEAKYNDGVLSIVIPKREEAKKKPAREIAIS